MDCNAVETLPRTMQGMRSLRTASFRSNCLRTLPSSLGDLRALTELDLSHNRIDSVPEEAMAGLGALRVLNLSVNQIFLLQSLAGLTALQHLDASRNVMTTLPDLPPSLQTCDASRNMLASARNLGLLTNLVKLDLSHNEIVGEFALHELHTVAQVDLRNNRIAELSLLKGPLTRLAELRLSANRLAALP